MISDILQIYTEKGETHEDNHTPVYVEVIPLKVFNCISHEIRITSFSLLITNYHTNSMK